ncbi:hypothetical protein F5B17DRAFT_382280 [Nemania serpens]|nr:hypothetical protein F5B17DRAFT_382280 [Nemania serpens]
MRILVAHLQLLAILSLSIRQNKVRAQCAMWDEIWIFRSPSIGNSSTEPHEQLLSDRVTFVSCFLMLTWYSCTTSI